MPVRKFRDVSEMPDDDWLEPGSPELDRAIAAVWERSAAMFPRSFPPGVYKRRDMGEVAAAEAAWHRADLERLWAKRGGIPTARPEPGG